MSSDASWMVTGSGLPIMARVMGRSASKATSLVSMVSRSCRKSWKAATELRRFTAMLRRTLSRMLRCTSSRLVVVRQAVMSSIESRKRVRSAGATGVHPQIQSEKNAARVREQDSLRQRTNLYPMPCTVRKRTGLDGSLSSFWRSLRMWLSTVRVEG